MDKIQFYKGRVALNCLAHSVRNAQEILEAAEGHVLVGVLSADYPDVESAVKDMALYQKAVDNNISVGLGAGNPNQSRAVAEISSRIGPKHINQTFTATGFTRGKTGEGPFLNALVSPCGRPGYVCISTGPMSGKMDPVIAPAASAIAMAKEQGADSLKFFPMGGLKARDELAALARICAQEDFALEPTGGITPGNFAEILGIALDAGVKRIIPHVYSSIIDQETGDTVPEQVRGLYRLVTELVK